MKKRFPALLLALTIILTLAACGQEPAAEATVDPHEGMVYVNTGGEDNWIYPAENVEAADFSAEDFTTDGNIVTYTGSDYETRLGVDVSFYQGEIDWEAVKAAGIDFAMIRCGYRGSSEGALFEDDMFRANIEGAIAAGLDVGVYFFSQSVGAIEAAEEANYVLGLIADYNITMPVAFDWEPLENSRTSDVDTEALTASAEVFCEMIKDAGYEPCVYLYRKIAYYDYDMTGLSSYMLWVGAPGDYPDFYYDHDIWQFSYQSTIDGIAGEVDLNLYFIRITPEPSPSPTASA